MIRVFESFAGIGTQRMGLERAGIEHEVVGLCEIDKFAIDSYQAIHGQVNNYGDISKVNPKELLDFDLFTYSFPCQDISMAGKQKGFDKESGTRSSLLWECERIIQAKRPKYLLMENVKALIFKKNLPGFEKWLEILSNLSYTNYWKVLNSKDYGVPQNRERVFCISILDDKQGFEFPEKQVLKTRLKDVLEDKVDEKYYLSNDRVKQLVGIVRNWGVKGKTVFDSSINEPKEKEVANCITTKQRGITNRRGEGNVVVEPELIQTHKLNNDKRDNPNIFRVFDKEGISPTLNTFQGGGRQPCIDEVDNEPRPILTHKRYRKNRNMPSEYRVFDDKGLSPTITCGHQPCVADNDKGVVLDDFRIRKLTPLEFWRLMGIEDEDFYKARKVNSDSQLYKQAGNAIVVDVLAAIFVQLLNK